MELDLHVEFRKTDVAVAAWATLAGQPQFPPLIMAAVDLDLYELSPGVQAAFSELIKQLSRTLVEQVMEGEVSSERTIIGKPPGHN